MTGRYRVTLQLSVQGDHTTPHQANNYHQMFNTGRRHIILMMTVCCRDSGGTELLENSREIYQKPKLRISFLFYQEREREQLELV